MTPDPKPEPKQKERPAGQWIGGRLIARMKPFSQRRSKGERKYKKARKEHLAENPTCAINKCCQPGTKATTVHHKRGREGKLLWDKKWFLSACLECHQYIEKHVKWARKMGFTMKRY